MDLVEDFPYELLRLRIALLGKVVEVPRLSRLPALLAKVGRHELTETHEKGGNRLLELDELVPQRLR